MPTFLEFKLREFPLADSVSAVDRSVQAWHKPDLTAVSLNDKGSFLVARWAGREAGFMGGKLNKNRQFSAR